MRTRLMLGLLACLSLAACSGGGGSAPSAPSGSGSDSTQSAVSAQEAAQAGTEAATTAVEQGVEDSGLYNNQMGISLAGSARQPQGTPSGTCRNGVINTATTVSATEKIYETKYFYDKACVTLARDMTADVKTGTGGETIAYLAKTFSATSQLLTTRATTFTIAGTPGSPSISETAVGSVTIGTSTTPATQFARNHSITTAAASKTSQIGGSSADVVNNGAPAVNESFGHAAQLVSVTKTTDASGNVTFAGTRNAQVYKSALGGLTISTAPPFTISGATPAGVATVTGSVTWDTDGDINALTVSATLLGGYTVTMSGSGDPIAIAGTVKDAKNNPVATFTLDQFGNGIITYSNGTQGVIMDWHIVR